MTSQKDGSRRGQKTIVGATITLQKIENPNKLDTPEEKRRRNKTKKGGGNPGTDATINTSPPKKRNETQNPSQRGNNEYNCYIPERKDVKTPKKHPHMSR